MNAQRKVPEAREKEAEGVAARGVLRRWLPLLGLCYLVAVCFGVWGYMVGGYHAFPYDLLKTHSDNLKAFLRGGEGQDKSLVEKLTTHIQEVENRFEYSGLVRRDKDFRDPGYVLLSRFSAEHEQVVVELVRAADFGLLHRWVPPTREILTRGGREEDLKDLRLAAQEVRYQHPLLLEDGSIVVSDGEGVLARVSKENEPLWVIGKHFHHSLEWDMDGNILVPGYEYGRYPKLHRDMREETIVVVSPEGRVLREYELVDSMLRAGHASLMIGVNDLVNRELLHTNDIHPILEDRSIARRGDYALSFQRISTVAFFRPSENRIVAIRQGPWFKQHDITPLPDGRYSIFDNRSFVLEDGSYGMYTPQSALCIWDPVTDEVTTPYAEAFRRADIRTRTQGRARVLPDGDAIVEENEFCRLLRISKDRVRWEYVNADPDEPGVCGQLHWCRYFMEDEIDLGWLR